VRILYDRPIWSLAMDDNATALAEYALSESSCCHRGEALRASDMRQYVTDDIDLA